MSELLLTQTGIPNTCCKCGEMQSVEWYAKNEDEARSGQGKCPPCAGLKPKVKPKRTRRRKAAPPKSEEQQA